MKTIPGLALFIAAGLMMGCASTSNAPQETAASTAESAQTAAEAQEAAAIEAAKAPDAPKSKLIAQECKKNILQMVAKQEGGQQFLLDDATLWQVMPDGSTKLVKKLPDEAKNYFLIPSTDVIIHYTNDNKIMLIHVESDKEFFNLKGDASLRTVLFTPDNNEMGIMDKDNRINIWNVPKKFTGIHFSETVQEFINRQSSDYYLRFSAGAYAVSLAGNSRAVLAADEVDTGKIGLIFHMDENTHKGVLKNLGRTNAHITHLAIPLSAKNVAVCDENGQLYVTSTGEDKGFKVYANAYKDTVNVNFIGENVLVIGKEKLTLIDVSTGFEIWTRDVSAQSCYTSQSNKLFCNTGDTVEEINPANGKLVRTLFFNDTTWGELVNGTELGGTASTTCLK